VDQYRTEEEQVEALRRWWDENGKSIIAAIVIAVALGFGWQTWKSNDQREQESASDLYQAMLQAVAVGAGDMTPAQQATGVELAEQLKNDYSGSTYAQFAAMHLARLAVEENDLAEAEAQLRWVLGKADKGSDAAQVAQMRLARVVAASGDTDQALAILEQGDEGPYQASYAIARGDTLLALGRNDEAREAYSNARLLAASSQGQVNMPALEQKLQSLTPIPARTIGTPAAAMPAAAADPVSSEAVDVEADTLIDAADDQEG
jgi:predicted negative regulator of RcsB-dependent stress response